MIPDFWVCCDSWLVRTSLQSEGLWGLWWLCKRTCKPFTLVYSIRGYRSMTYQNRLCSASLWFLTSAGVFAKWRCLRVVMAVQTDMQLASFLTCANALVSHRSRPPKLSQRDPGQEFGISGSLDTWIFRYLDILISQYLDTWISVNLANNSVISKADRFCPAVWIGKNCEESTLASDKWSHCRSATAHHGKHWHEYINQNWKQTFVTTMYCRLRASLGAKRAQAGWGSK